MIRKIYIFESVKKAREILSDFNKQFKYPQNSEDDNSVIVKKSVGSNIFRSFRDVSKPSEVYRKWANKNLVTIIHTLSTINCVSEFDKYLDELNNSLLCHWIELSGHKLGYGPSIKMINLLIKTIMEQKKYHCQKLLPFLHVPFDQYSLKPLINIINDLTYINYKINIPKNVTMQFVTTKELYLILLKAIRVLLSNLTNLHPIIYDYWSWNDKHKDWK